MTPEEIGNKIYYLRDSNQILKLGSRVRMAEAEAMRFVASRTSILVPHVHEAYERPGIGEGNCDSFGYIFMSKIEGHMLGTMWKKLLEAERAVVVDQLRGYVHQLRDLRGECYGALWNRPCEDIFFHHLCVAKPGDQRYGPDSSRTDYN